MKNKLLVDQARDLNHKIFRLVEIESIGRPVTPRTKKLRTAYQHAHARFRRRLGQGSTNS